MLPTITKVDPREGTVTVKMADKKGMEVEKNFHLTDDIEYFDSTGRVITLDVFQSGDEVLVIEMEGKIKKLERATPLPSGTTRPPRTAHPAAAPVEKGHDVRSVCADDIRLRAYEKWEGAGKPAGDGIQFWLEAEQELRRGK